MKFKHLAVIAVIISSLFMPRMAEAQMAQPLPIDPAVRIGTLPNGLTYMIRRNEQPKERAEFYIAQKVGSILEEDSQSGLAHFLEHMCFNGTQNFPGKTLINYLETIGVRFGYNLNAYTAFDRTVYTIMDAPTTRQGVIDSCLLILHDWSGYVSLEDKEIDEERGVIHEEWRQSTNANMRMITEMLPKLYPNNVYGKRLPIGSMDVVDHFKYKELRDYYHKWYRPDQQAIIVVGDIDVDKIEADIKRIFSHIPKHENPAERFIVEVADNEEPIVAIATDPEATSTDVSIMFKTDVLPRELRGTIAGLMMDYLKQVISSMTVSRFRDITDKPNAPFLSGYGYIGNYMVSNTKDAYSFNVDAREGELLPAMKALVAEIAKIQQFGFNASEYERARKEILKGYENAFNERDKQKNNKYANEYVDYFCDGGYIPGIETEKQIMESVANQIPVEMINEQLKELFQGEKNLVITVTAPKKDGLTYPTEAELLNYYREYIKQPVEAYKEEVSDQKLMEKAPKAGKIVSEKKNQPLGTTLLTLSNGIKVYLKKTDFKNNQVLFRGVMPGGTNAYNNPKDLMTVRFINSLIDLGGLAQYDATQLRKVLTGRSFSVSPVMGETESYFRGNSTNEDLETMFQSIYLYATQNRVDKDAYKAFVQKLTENIKNMASNPMVSFQDSIIYALYNNNPKNMRPTVADVAKINYERAMQIYKERFSDLDEMTFFFVGSFDEATIKPLIATYLGSLPVNKKTKGNKYEDRTVAMRKAPLAIDFSKELETPMATVLDVYTGTMDYTLKNDLLMEILPAVLDQVYTAEVREKEGGTYGVSSNGSISDSPLGETALQIYFQMAPENVNKLNAIVHRELQKIANEGPSEEHFRKTVENMKKSYQERLHENSFWLSAMVERFSDKRDFVTDYEKTLNSLTTKDLKEFTKKFIGQGNKIEVIIRSTKTEADKK